MKKRVALIGALLLAGCGTEINMSEYSNNIKQPIVVPEICKAEYNSLKEVPRVAVIRFSNNSSLGKANTTTENGSANYSHSAAAGIAVGEGGIAGVEADKERGLNSATS